MESKSSELRLLDIGNLVATVSRGVHVHIERNSGPGKLDKSLGMDTQEEAEVNNGCETKGEAEHMGNESKR